MLWSDIKTSFKNRVFCGRLENDENIIEPTDFLNKCSMELIGRVGEFMYKFRSMLKLNCELVCEYILKKGDDVIYSTIYHTSKMSPITLNDDFLSWFDENVQDPILNHMSEFQERDSGKALNRILHLQVNINEYNPINSSGSSYIDLPKNIAAKQAIINIKNTDDKCFVWSVISALFPASRNPNRLQNYPSNYNEILNLTNIRFPTPLSDIPKFEKQNNISINVYGLEYNGKTEQYDVVGPLHYTKSKRDKHINLLYWKNWYQAHYAWIKSLARLLNSQLSKNTNHKYICDRCLQYFSREDLLIRHEEDCNNFDAVKIEMPQEDEKWLRFTNYSANERHPFVIYADIESMTVPIHTCQPNHIDSYTNSYQQHLPCAVGYLVKCSYDESKSFYESYCGLQPISWFLNRLDNVIDMIRRNYSEIIPIKMTKQNIDDFNLTTICHICKNPFITDTDENKKVQDHCHLTGRYRGAAHNSCNLLSRLPKRIPIFFHNLSGYDGHMIVKELGRDKDKTNTINIIPSTEERYISFTKQNYDFSLTFLDSYRFMPSSLEKLTSYMDETKFKLMTKYFPKESERKLLLRKGVFPYDYFSSWDCLKENSLPPQTAFFSKLKNEHISNEDYQHAKVVWNTFSHKTFEDYMNLYLKTDVLLLADIFENFRDVCQKAYNLDPAYYYTTPGLAWDVMLKVTGVELQLLTDIDQLIFFERGIRGGISQCSNRYSKSNNRYMKSYNPEELEKFLMYFDACNLYGWAMTQCLPINGFEWVTDWSGLDIISIPEDSPVGYVFEVDLKYPKHLHDKHKDLPLLPEHRIPPGSKSPKLLTTCFDKKNYIIHYRNLQQILSLGIEIIKISRVIKFNQSFWLKKYIDLNTDFRKEANNEFEKKFYKLMNNAVFGKSMENIRNRRTIKLVTKWDGRGGARQLIAKPNCKKVKFIDDDLVSIELNKVKIKFRKPIFIGMVILDVSKFLMYDFHYNFIHKIFTIPKLLYMDTDSLLYEFTSEDPYVHIKANINRFDTSDFPTDNRYGIPQANKKVVGLFKDENAGILMTEFVGLRAKMYTFALENENVSSKVKGISGVVTKTLTIDDYKNTLFHKKNLFKKQNNIISKNHDVFTVEQNKLTLSVGDDKRFIINDSTDTLPWGHYSINI